MHFFPQNNELPPQKEIGTIYMPKSTVKKLKNPKIVKKMKKGFTPLHEVLSENKPLQWLVILKNRVESKKLTPKDLEINKIISEETIQRILENKYANNRRASTWRGLIQSLLINKVFETSTEILDWLLIDPVFPDKNQCLNLALTIKASKNTRYDDSINIIEHAKARGWWTRYPSFTPNQNYLSRNIVEQNILQDIKAINFLQVNPTYKTLIYHGIAGCGKTTIFQHICTDEDLRKVFMDGIIWIKDTLRSGREALISLGNQIHSEQADNVSETPVAVEEWEKWLTKEDRRALIIIDNPATEILEVVLRTHPKRIQFVILTTDQHAAFRTASAFFQRDEIRVEQIGSLDLEEAVAHWIHKKTSDNSLPTSVRNNFSEISPEIFEWCERISFLPGVVRFILETTLEKAWGYTSIMLTPETLGVKELGMKILEHVPVSELLLIETLLKKMRTYWFTLDQAQNILPEATDLPEKLHNWKLQGFLTVNLNGPNEKEKYQFISILSEMSDLSKKHNESIQEWIKLHRIKMVKNQLDEIEAKQASVQKKLI